MTRETRRSIANQSELSGGIPRVEWKGFLESFSRLHFGQPVRLEIHDLQTQEIVNSPEALLQSIDFDLEDEKNPRINVTVKSGVKTIKHILFLPSKLALKLSKDHVVEALTIESIHAVTTAHLLLQKQREGTVLPRSEDGA